VGCCVLAADLRVERVDESLGGRHGHQPNRLGRRFRVALPAPP
jgi:hypothetical protein